MLGVVRSTASPRTVLRRPRALARPAHLQPARDVLARRLARLEDHARADLVRRVRGGLRGAALRRELDGRLERERAGEDFPRRLDVVRRAARRRPSTRARST